MKLKRLWAKKGEIIGGTVNNLITLAMGLLILAGVVVGVTAFKGTQVKAIGCNSTVTTGCSAAWNLTRNTEHLVTNFGSELDTVGTMFGVGLIIAAIAVLGYGLMKQ